MVQSNSYLRIHPQDNVLIATRDLPAGLTLRESPPVAVREAIPLGHKLASRPIGAGEDILKYGQPIGVAKQPIDAGEWVHVHNVAVAQRSGSYDMGRDASAELARKATRMFQGYRRASGKSGTRNYVAIISSVNCSASVSKAIARNFDSGRLSAFPNVDGVVAFTHHGGCAMQFNGQQHQILNRVLGGIARHPNIGGYLLIGLGCEKATLEFLIDDQRLVQIDGTGSSGVSTRPPTLVMQAEGGTAKTIEAGIRCVEKLLPQVNDVERVAIPASELILATQCGGSDGSSGLTANPAVGVACDLLVDEGGTAILGETTEIVGAEQLLTRRAASETVARKLLAKIEWWKWYAGLFGESIDDNRSAGNAAGGLTTIAEKSLGAIAKGGSRPLVEVYEYGQTVDQPGLVFMDSPGFDPVSTTGMVAGGANLVVFTTGRGSCYGCKPSPTIKIATNTPMFRRMEADMDLDAGPILAGAPVEQVGREIFEMLLAVASGKATKSESQGLGDEEFIPWMIGPVL
jgi:altronate dehydratase